jgi:small-conductance mechanosensitive channel
LRGTPWRLMALLLVGAVVVAVTAGVVHVPPLAFLEPYRVQLIAAELALIGIIFVEALTSMLARFPRGLLVLPPSPALRPVVRFLGYAVLGVSIVSLLSASPALAVGVGSVTGLVVGLAAQSIIGNALAGSILSLLRPFQVGGEITVQGLTGRVVEVGSIYTLIDLGEREALVPNIALLTSVIQRPRSLPRADMDARE